MSEEFRPIEAAPARRAWPYAVLGICVLAAAIIYVRRPQPAAAAAPAIANEKLPEQPVQALANLAPKIDAQQLQQAMPKAPESPNILGALATPPAEKARPASKSELAREEARVKAAQREAAEARQRNASLQRELDAARAQIASLQQAKRGPPPSDQEQILQTLAPVLRTSSNDGRP